MGKAVLVTGGATGIGRAIVENMAADHDVALVWNRRPPGSLPKDVLAIQQDLSADDAGETIIAAVVERFGRLDVIVNNAGIVAQTKAEGFDRTTALDILDINTLAPAVLLDAALLHLKPGAAVVNISSTNAVLPPRDASIYGASKAALNLWTKAMAKELGPRGIRVNAVAPGATHIAEDPRPDDLNQLFVDMTALGRIGQVQDIAKAVRFMASDEAGFITGEVLNVNGGYRL
ncbi:MAG: SDR family oxidoreductase [Pseudomonadota bacterium]